jgi:hypothetical protein
MKPACYACIHMIPPEKTVDGSRLCRAYGLPVSLTLEADCTRNVPDTDAADEVPVWYADAWHVGGEGRGD